MEQPAAPPRKKPAPPKGARRKAGAPMSRESRFIGYVVLGFGVLAVATVLILAFSGGVDVKNAPVPQQEAVKAIQSDLASTPSPPATPSATQAAPREQAKPVRRTAGKLAFARQSDIPVSDMNGGWQSMIGKYTAVIQLDGKVYQIILASSDPAASRVYSSGTYQVVDDIITFTPRTDWPEPSNARGASLKYNKLTRSPFSLLVGFQQGRMLMQNVPSSEDRVLTTPYSAMFMNEKVDYVVWQKIGK